MPFLIGPLLASFTCAVNIVIDPTTTGKYQTRNSFIRFDPTSTF